MSRKALPSWIAFLVSLLLWHLIVSFQWVPVYLLPAPLQVIQALQENAADFSKAFLSTLVSTLIGFFLSAFLGFGFALILTSVPILKRALLPFAVFFQTVPIVAIAPLLVIWLGFGEPTVRACAFIVSFFPVLANSLVGLSNVDETLSELFLAYGASPFQKLVKLQIPGSLPSVLAGLQVAAGLAVIGAIVGEFVAGGGLGGLIDTARTQQRVDFVFAAIFLSSLLGVLLVSGLRLISKVLLKIRPYYSQNLEF